MKCNASEAEHNSLNFNRHNDFSTYCQCGKSKEHSKDNVNGFVHYHLTTGL